MSKRQFIPTYGYFIIGGFILILGLTIGGLKLQSTQHYKPTQSTEIIQENDELIKDLRDDDLVYLKYQNMVNSENNKFKTFDPPVFKTSQQKYTLTGKIHKIYDDSTFGIIKEPTIEIAFSNNGIGIIKCIFQSNTTDSDILNGGIDKTVEYLKTLSIGEKITLEGEYDYYSRKFEIIKIIKI